jgi:hypothetical protein
MNLWAGIFLLGVVADALLGWHGWPAVFAGQLPDPDSALRLLRLREGIAHCHLSNLVSQDSGPAILTSWSRLLDILLWLIAAPFAPVLGWTRAVFAAGVVLGPLSVGLLGLALAFAARPFAEDRLLWTAALAAASLPGLRQFEAPGTVTEAILLLAALAACAGFSIRCWRAPSTGLAFCAGLAGGLAVWFSPVALPFVLLASIPILLRWLDRPVGAVVTAAAAGFIDVIGLGYVVDPPQGGYFDTTVARLSVVYVALGLFLLLAAGVLWRLQGLKDIRARRMAGPLICGAFLIAWILLFPAIPAGLGGALKTLPPPSSGEMMRSHIPGILALLYAIWRAGAAKSWLPAYLAICIVVALALSARFVLFAGFPGAAAATLLPVALSEARSRLRARHTVPRRS